MYHPMIQISAPFIQHAEIIPSLNKYKEQLYGLELHLARDITALEKLKLSHPLLVAWIQQSSILSTFTTKQ